MKLTPENIVKIEAVLTDWENGHGQRRIVVDHNISGVNTVVQFFSVMRSLGVPVPKGSLGGLALEDRVEFTRWLREKRAKENAERGL